MGRLEVVVVDPEIKDWSSLLMRSVVPPFVAASGLRFIARRAFDRELGRWEAYRLVTAAAGVAKFVIPDRRSAQESVIEGLAKSIVASVKKSFGASSLDKRLEELRNSV